jgi:hypothetical protein
VRFFRFIVLVLAMVAAVMPIASAGGSWMDTPDEYVEPGEIVEFVGYVGAENADEGPWYAYLNSPEGILALGPVTIETTGLGGYLSHRVYLAFTVPSTLTTGSYSVSVQNGAEFNKDRTEFLGDLAGAVVEVGMVRTSSYYPWPIDEPLVASLPPDAVLIGPDWEITVGEVRSGTYPKCQWGCLLDPTVLRREDVTIVDALPSWATTTAPPTTTPSSTTTTAMSTGALVEPGTTSSDVRTEVPQDASNDTVLMAAGVLLAIGVSFVGAARFRDSQVASIPEPKVLEDDLSEPTRV